MGSEICFGVENRFLLLWMFGTCVSWSLYFASQFSFLFFAWFSNHGAVVAAGKLSG